MNRTALGIGIAATACVTLGGVFPAAAHAATFPMRKTTIVLNGQTFSNPMAFTDPRQDTTYMPIYYVHNLLNSLGIKDSWDGADTPQVWSMQTGETPVSPLNIVCKTGSVNIVLNGTTVEQKVNKEVATDPYSGQPTTFIPIWYIQQMLHALGLHDIWDGNTWSISVSYLSDSKSGQIIGGFHTLSDAIASLKDYPGGTVKNASGEVVYTRADFATVDLRFPAPANVTAASINEFLSSHGSPLTGLGDAVMNAQQTYSVDANYLVAHALHESSWGKSDWATRQNNLYGYGAYDNDTAAGVFPSEAYAIAFQAWEVRNNYLDPNASHYVAPTLNGMAHNYASDPSWAANVGILMNQFAIDLNDTVDSYPQYDPAASTPVPAPSSTAEPVYMLPGGRALALPDAYYTAGVPVYPDMTTGAQTMFTRTLQFGDKGLDVETLQKAMNRLENANLTVDGDFGANTQSAVETFQKAHGVGTPNGIVDFQMWTQDLGLPAPISYLAANSGVNVDQVKQGMAGDTVTLWYHVPNVGWVNGDDLMLQNVYRLSVSDPTSASDAQVAVYAANGSTAPTKTLHAGDWVVCSTPNAQGASTIQYADPFTGNTSTGLVRASDAALVQVHSGQ